MRERHGRYVVVWDVPPAVERGARFRVKVGVKCASGCGAEGWIVELRDSGGKTLATTRLADEPWTGTAALYYAEVTLAAADTEGLAAWSAFAPAIGSDLTDGPGHDQASARFNIRTVPPSECLLKVVAVEAKGRAPIEGARVVVHPYRAFTDERGVAELRVPKGKYRLFVSGGDYFPFQSDREVQSDTTIEAELVPDLGPTDAELWP